MIIACSSEADILYRIMNGEEAGTLFGPKMFILK